MNDADIIDHRGDSPHPDAAGGYEEPVLHPTGSLPTAPDGQDLRADRDWGEFRPSDTGRLEIARSRSVPDEDVEIVVPARARRSLILAPWHRSGQSLDGVAWSSRLRLTVIAATVAVAALTGSAVTASVWYWSGSHAAPPSLPAARSASAAPSASVAPPAPAAPTASVVSNNAAVAEALGRVDRKLAVLTAKVNGIAKPVSQPAARTHDRVERTEKPAAEPAAKLPKASDAIERVERRLAGTTWDGAGADWGPPIAAPPVMGLDMRRPAAAPIVEGWTVRDVYNGSALLQSRGGMLQVYPGDYIQGLGRIEQLRRQDGRWVVVTSRGLIASR